MERKKDSTGFLFYAAAVCIGICGFAAIYGIKVLNPCYNDWLLRGGDLTQHYIGWEFFRASNWYFPVGLMDTIAYPNRVSVIFTDSIPVFAVLFKLLSPVLPEKFQYFGWWELLCFILQAVLSAEILFYLTRKRAASLAGSLFFVAAPVFVARAFFHTALSSQWLLLLALYMGRKYFDKKEKKIPKSMLRWGALGMLCGSVHLYYIPMCGIIMLGFLIAETVRDKNWEMSLLAAEAYIIGAGIPVFMLGGFSHDHQLDALGLGQFSFNMNGFFNSMGWSKIFPALQAYGEGFTDGFSYLGLGIFAIIFTDIIWGLKKRKGVKREFNYAFIAYGFICIACILVSASPKFALDRNHVITLPYPQKLVSLWGMFRASGRFIWPVYYLVFLFSIAALFRHVKNDIWVIVIAICAFAVQMYDISDVLHSKRAEFAEEAVYVSRLQAKEWEELAEGREHVVFVSHVTENQDILYSVSQYAYLHGMTINDFYLAHSAAAEDIQKSLEESMADLREDTLYIFKMSDKEMCGEYDLEYRILDEIIVGVVGKK